MKFVCFVIATLSLAIGCASTPRSVTATPSAALAPAPDSMRVTVDSHLRAPGVDLALEGGMARSRDYFFVTITELKAVVRAAEPKIKRLVVDMAPDVLAAMMVLVVVTGNQAGVPEVRFTTPRLRDGMVVNSGVNYAPGFDCRALQVDMTATQASFFLWPPGVEGGRLDPRSTDHDAVQQQPEHEVEHVPLDAALFGKVDTWLASLEGRNVCEMVRVRFGGRLPWGPLSAVLAGLTKHGYFLVPRFFE